MLEAIRQAKESIYIEMYIFLDDTQLTHNFLKLLMEKAQSGLEVVVIADAYGSASLNNGIVSGLKSSGIEFRYFSHWFKRTHRKLLIIDRKIAFLGGVNIEEKFRSWNDLQIMIAGKIVQPLLRSFANTYKLIGGRRTSITIYAAASMTKKIRSWIVDNLGPSKNLSSYYKQKIDNAKKDIVIVTPYLLPPRWLLASLDEACRRGVSVSILIPGETDIKLVSRLNYLNICLLNQVGVKFYLGSAMNHAKIMLIDNEEGVIGSQNLDVLSFNWNIEVGVFFRQKDLVRDIYQIVDRWRQESLPFAPSNRRLSFSDRLLMFCLKVFYPMF